MAIGDVLSKIDVTARQSSKATYSQCKTDPRACMRQVLVDCILLVAMFMVGLYVIDGVAPTLEYLQQHVLKYTVVFALCSFAMRYLDVDYGDALSRGAAVVIAAKFVTALSPTETLKNM